MQDREIFIVPTYAGPLATDVRYRREWLAETNVLSRRHFEKLEQGHIAALTVGIDSFEDVIALSADIDESQGRFLLCRTPNEVQAAWQRGAVGIMLAPAFAAIGGRLDTLTVYKMLGAVSFAFSLNMRNLLADGCGERNAGGLSHLGVQAVRRLEQLGIVIDVSHLSAAGFWDVAEIATRPITASHSNAFALCANPRNLKDDQLKAIAKTGGCVGVSVHSSLLSDGTPTVDDYVSHIEYIVKLIGDDSVMLGADFIDFHLDFTIPKLRKSNLDGKIYHEDYLSVPGLENYRDMPGVLTRLRQRGFSDESVAKIAWRNWMRVLRRVGGMEMEEALQ